MPRPTATNCTRCKRAFGKVPNPTVASPQEGDMLQRRGTTANCQSCYSFVAVCPKFKGLSAKQINKAIEDDPDSYQRDLQEYEQSRRDGKRYRGEKATSVLAETRQGMQTRRLLGYLWTESLLQKHQLSHLWKSLPKQSISHMGKMVQGVLRESFAAGTVEVYETSDTQAVRSQLAADCEADEVEQADKVFQDLGAGLRLQAVDQEPTEDGSEAGIILKNPKRAKVDAEVKVDADDDDFMQVWGVSSLTSGSASSSRTNKADKEDNENKPVKKPRTSAAKNQSLTVGDGFFPSTDTSSNAEYTPGSGFGQSASWLFGMKVPGSQKKGTGKSQQKDLKGLDASEKILGQHENFKKYLAQDSTFMSLSFQKITGHSEKLHSRNAPELQKIYRDLANGQTDGRACQIMKRLAQALTEIAPMCQFVSAFRDQEATAETMMEGLQEARDAGLEISGEAEKLCMARLLLQHAKNGKHDEFFRAIESSELKGMFKEDKDGMTEFLFCSLKSAVNNILNSELEAPGFENFGKEIKEAGSISVEEKAMQNVAVDRTKLLLSFIDGFKQSKVCEDWAEHQQDCVQIVQWLDDISKLHILACSAIADEGEATTADKVEELKASRSHLLAKKNNFAESMTLWPLGQFVQQKANSRVEVFLRDQSLKADLGQCVQLATQLKTFSTDALFKADSLEIAIPGLNKVVEMVQKFSMLQQLGSKLFLQDNEEQIRIVTLKITELQNAILGASVHKFRKSVGENLAHSLDTLATGQMDTDLTARLVEQINEAKSFNPMQANVLSKCLGAWAAPIQEALQETRTFWTRFAAVVPAVVGLTCPASAACAVPRLLCSDLVALMEIYNDPSKMQLVQKICVDVGSQIMKIGDTMKILAKEASSFLQFTAFLSSSCNEEGLVQDVVGEFQGDDDKVVVDYIGMYKLYGKYLPEDFVCVEFIAPSGESTAISAASICAAGACLPLAKMIVHFATWAKEFRSMPAGGVVFDSCPTNPAEVAGFYAKSRMHMLGEKAHETAKFMHTLRVAYEAAETTRHDMARKFVASSANRAPQLLGKVIDVVQEDVKTIISGLVDSYAKVTVRAEFQASLDDSSLDGKLGASMCLDESVQKIYRFLNFGIDSFTGLKQVMIGISGAATLLGSCSLDMSGFEVTTVTAKAVIQTIQEFTGTHESGDQVCLQSICSMLANCTMVQAMTRDLKTGETRTNLVNKAMSGIKKRQWKLHASLTQRCTEILSGKAKAVK
ncbi:unnamed protein product [Symbiodinium sp. CCMP2456]|nr:unnamed protein product [Symbiodinium sp. CCMP2456]